MKFNVVALFAASAIAAVLPEEPAYPEAPVPTTSEAAYPETTEPAYPEVPSSSEEASPEPTSTYVVTELITITDCPPTVTDCPADYSEVSSVVITSTVCEDEPTETPGGEYPEETPSTSAEEESPEPTASVCEPEVYEKTITTSYTTVVETTIVETFTSACAEPTGEEEYPEPTGTGPSGPSESYPAGNSTTPEEEYPEEPVVAGASAVFGSVFTVAAAAVAAFAFA
ncbi:uncharacterized protein DNG_03911 [Cephalotrichum gorgonifer]|uniref:Uncharacterized protein n=1 Tax=Cephalotrichum gorgonifer TaxID=2041049 RepID=A0AAE8MX15_9PEZI|nr:uncharacterized protein DNG_03911 [Cephalotrichum gorgonifer]